MSTEETQESLGRELAALCRRLHACGWVANHDGNVSVRMGDGRILASPTAVSKADVQSDMLVVVDGDGKVVAGSRRVFSEINLHLACYRARPDIRWVVHAHPCTATGMAVAGACLFDPPFLAEAVVSLGDRIPLVPYMAPGSNTAAMEEALLHGDALLLRNHGVLTVGNSAEQAFLRMELVEHLAKIQAAAQAFGGPQALPEADVERLLEARRKAGLGVVVAAANPVVPEAVPANIENLVQEALRRWR